MPPLRLIDAPLLLVRRRLPFAVVAVDVEDHRSLIGKFLWLVEQGGITDRGPTRTAVCE